MTGLQTYDHKLVTAGCDEAGRGCLAGPVFAAAVILAPGFENEEINDSKKLTFRKRQMLSEVIQRDAVTWGVGIADPSEIDELNILNASILAMHRALDELSVRPEFIIVDGNRFHSYHEIPYSCIIKGDCRFIEIAAASILAKCLRDEYMLKLHREYPSYGWDANKGYPSPGHIEALLQHGTTPHHRKTFHVKRQLRIPFP